MAFEPYKTQYPTGFNGKPFITVLKNGCLTLNVKAAALVKDWRYVQVFYCPDTNQLRLVKCNASDKYARKLIDKTGKVLQLNISGAMRYWKFLPKKTYRVRFKKTKDTITFKINKAMT